MLTTYDKATHIYEYLTTHSLEAAAANHYPADQQHAYALGYSANLAARLLAQLTSPHKTDRETAKATIRATLKEHTR